MGPAPRVVVNFTDHKIAITIGEGQAEDEALESFVENTPGDFAGQILRAKVRQQRGGH
jgi:hypothetical protein